MNKFYSNIFEIPPNGNLITAQQNTQVLPSNHKNYYLLNIGKVPITAEVLFGTSLGWNGIVVGPIKIQPGMDSLLDLTNKLYIQTAVKVYNESSLRAVVHVGRDDGLDWNQKPENMLKMDINNIPKGIINFGPANIPFVGEKLDAILEFFWPQKDCIWGIVIDPSAQIPTKLKIDLRQLRTRVINLNALIEHKEASSGISVPYHFMQLMEDLIGYEKKFVVSQEVDQSDFINFIYLPYYSTMVTLKMCLYQYGIVNRIKINLNDEQVRRLLLLSKQLIEDKIDGAVNHINSVHSQAILSEYNNCDPRNIYDSLASVFTYSGLTGLEYIPFWNGILTNPFWKKKVYNDTILFSTYFGRPSPQLYIQLTQKDISEPLLPQLINGTRNKIARIDVWLWRKNFKTLPKIGGMSVHYLNGDVSKLGGVTQEARSVSFKESLLIELIVWGDGSIDCLQFIFSDGRQEICGSNEGVKDNYHCFKLDQHHISGIFLANDVPVLQKQAANIAVPFQLV